MTFHNEEDLLVEDEIYEKYKSQRIKELLKEIPEIVTENELIKLTQHETMIVHFYDDTFETCKIMNKELNKIYKDFENISFYKIKADICPIVTNKLEIKILPFLGFFKNGFFVDQIVGFEGMGDERFNPEKLRNKIRDSNIYKPVSYIK
ncbi:thioredoxin [Vairimorpha necatrix]|uniref:Thioredoxin n=1 Tax=Vairimorpha necatrix TaxID=6039 RepID=A0AAX4JD99_9MICR